MSKFDMYEGLPMRWQWPNRFRDIDYLGIAFGELDNFDERARQDGWFKTAKLDPSKAVDLGHVPVLAQPGKKLLKGLEEARLGWLELEPGSLPSTIASHAWHRHMEQIDLWRGEDLVLLPPTLYPKTNFDACSEFLYTTFVSVYEAQRMLFNGTLRARMWLARELAIVDSGRSSAYDVKGLRDCHKWMKDCFDSLWFRGRRYGWEIRVPDELLIGLEGWQFSFDELQVLHWTGIRRAEWLAALGRKVALAPKRSGSRRSYNILTSVCDGVYRYRTQRCLRYCAL